MQGMDRAARPAPFYGSQRNAGLHPVRLGYQRDLPPTRTSLSRFVESSNIVKNPHTFFIGSAHSGRYPSEEKSIQAKTAFAQPHSLPSDQQTGRNTPSVSVLQS